MRASYEYQKICQPSNNLPAQEQNILLTKGTVLFPTLLNFPDETEVDFSQSDTRSDPQFTDMGVSVGCLRRNFKFFAAKHFIDFLFIMCSNIPWVASRTTSELNIKLCEEQSHGYRHAVSIGLQFCKLWFRPRTTQRVTKQIQVPDV